MVPGRRGARRSTGKGVESPDSWNRIGHGSDNPPARCHRGCNDAINGCLAARSRRSAQGCGAVQRRGTGTACACGSRDRAAASPTGGRVSACRVGQSTSFFPATDFPTELSCFVPSTIDELKRRQADREGREEALGKRSGYPSRQMEKAIREYAPGAEIVMDGRVYQSGGVTLNWHIPPGVESLNEVQALRHVWRCRQCGVTGDAPARPERCPHCDGVSGNEEVPRAGRIRGRSPPLAPLQRRVSNLYPGGAALDQLSDP